MTIDAATIGEYRTLLADLKVQDQAATVEPALLAKVAAATPTKINEAGDRVSVADVVVVLSETIRQYDARFSAIAVTDTTRAGTQDALSSPKMTELKVGKEYLAERPQDWHQLAGATRDFFKLLGGLEDHVVAQRAIAAGDQWPFNYFT